MEDSMHDFVKVSPSMAEAMKKVIEKDLYSTPYCEFYGPLPTGDVEVRIEGTLRQCFLLGMNAERERILIDK